MRVSTTRTVAVSLSLLSAAFAAAAIVHSTPGPFGGFFGLWGPDVSAQQSVGARFIPSANYTLTAIRIWFMNNSDTAHPTVHISLRDDSTNGTVSIPGPTTLAQWTINIQALGWNPIQESVVPTSGIGLVAGKKYWVVAESSSPGGEDAVWNFASSGNTFHATSLGGTWQPGGFGAALTLIVEGNPGLPNPADFNGDGMVNASDLTVVLSYWGICAGCAPDLNHDGIVDGADLAALLSAWSG